MRICILGAGGLGSLIGGWLAESGVAVTLVARAPHVAAIRARGLEIRGIRGECNVRRQLEAVASPVDARGEFDFLILAVKAKDTAARARRRGAAARAHARRRCRCRTRCARRTSSPRSSAPRA
jgi:2-dehydropantoate 2-reductase